jgi:hypothetical protein
MGGFNLPPGCSVNDIPGATEHALESVMEWAVDRLIRGCNSPEEVRIAVIVGLAAVRTARPVVKAAVHDAVAEERLIHTRENGE